VHKSSLQSYLSIAEPYFIFPDNKAVRGSSDLFRLLLNDLAQKELVALVCYRRLRNSLPVFAAMIPQLEVIENGIQIESRMDVKRTARF
jgi:hypothetical protein